MNSVNFTVHSDWGSGFSSNLSIQNTGTTAVKGWTLEFDAPFKITELWNAEIVKQEGTRYTIRNKSWNASIEAGKSISFGFNGSKTVGTKPQINNISLNNQPVSVPGQTPVEPTLPSISINDISVLEGNAGNTDASFEVKLSKASSKEVKVNFSTVDGTATAGSDYTATSGTLTFAPGVSTQRITLPIKSDTVVEPDETFSINLSNALNATVSKARGTGTIRNDDAAPTPTPVPSPLPTISINNTSTTEGDTGTKNAAFEVRLSRSSNQEVKVNFDTADGTAKAGSDYTAATGVVTFAPGTTTQTVLIPIVGDTVVEADETFSVKLSSPSTNAAIAKAEGMGTILNNDVAPSPTPNPTPTPTPNPTPTPTPATGNFNYAEALQKSLLFFEAQRSGDLPNNKRIDWRGDSALKDGADVGRDLSGGYYDAGDHVKFGLPMASSMTLMGWGAIEYKDAYAKIGQLDEVMDAIKWGTDYFLKAHVTENGKTKEFYGQVGNGGVDHAYWGSPEKMTMQRPSYKIDRQRPGSDLAGETAAALAAASIVFRSTDKAYADKLLQNAEQLFEFADTYRGNYSDSITDARSFYNSWSGYADELVWAASWLHKATGNQSYLNKAESYYQGVNAGWNQDWDSKSQGAGVLLAQATGKQKYKSDVESWLNNWDRGSVATSPGGQKWLTQWGSLRHSATMSFVAGVYSDTINSGGVRYEKLAESQIDYILGKNPRNSSYMVGFGNNFPKNPHHRAASGVTNISDSGPNRNIIYGALVGGPTQPNDRSYNDVRTDYVSNEVAMDYNAGFTGALARMYDNYGGNPLTNQQLDALPGISIANV